MRGFLGLAALPALAAGSPLFIDTIHNEAAPIVSSVNSKHIPNSYIVVFKDHVTKDAAEAHHLWVQGVHDSSNTERMELRKRSMSSDQESIFSGLKHTYHIPGSFLGYSGHFDEDVIEKVRGHPDVSISQSSHKPCSDGPRHCIAILLHPLLSLQPLARFGMLLFFVICPYRYRMMLTCAPG